MNAAMESSLNPITSLYLLDSTPTSRTSMDMKETLNVKYPPQALRDCDFGALFSRRPKDKRKVVRLMRSATLARTKCFTIASGTRNCGK